MTDSAHNPSLKAAPVSSSGAAPSDLSAVLFGIAVDAARRSSRCVQCNGIIYEPFTWCDNCDGERPHCFCCRTHGCDCEIVWDNHTTKFCGTHLVRYRAGDL